MSRTTFFTSTAARNNGNTPNLDSESNESLNGTSVQGEGTREVRLISRRGWNHLPNSLGNTIAAFNNLFQLTSSASNSSTLNSFETSSSSNISSDYAFREWQPQRRQITGQNRSKTVYRIFCGFCSSIVCNRGMRAILLADLKVELFSTDSPPHKKY